MKSFEYTVIWAGLFLSLFATSCRNDELSQTETSNSPSENESFISISGKLAQAYVDNATIILDRKLSGSHKGNCTQDAGEGKTHSDPFGVFSISVSHHDFVICTIGGTYKNSKGDDVPASPMLAPTPDSSNSAWNVTPLTTLVTTHPELKNKLDEMGGWNADIASPEGVPGRLLRLAKTVETFDEMTKQINQGDQQRLKAMEYLANSFKLNGVSTDNTTLLTSVKIALHNAMNDTEIIPTGSDAQSLSEEAVLNQVENVLTEGVFSAIKNTDVSVVEQKILSKIEIATDNATKAISGMLNNPPILSWIRTIPKFTSDSTPSFEFQSTKTGEITWGGGCLSDSTLVEYGINKITLKKLNQGIYDNCSISVTDQSGNKSEPLIVESFAIDTTSPVLKETSSVKTPSSVANPEYSFHADESGNIFFDGNCNSENDYALKGDNTITLSYLDDGIYENCSIIVVDKAGNVSNQLKLGSFEISANGSLEPDTKPPLLILIKDIESPSKDKSPSFTITSTEEGKLKTSGSCKSSILEVTTGENEITLNPLDDGTYSDCLVYVTDMFGNQSLPLNLSEFTIDSTEPVPEIVTPISTPGDTIPPLVQIISHIPSPTKELYPSFSLHTNESGILSFEKDSLCLSTKNDVKEGEQEIELSNLGDGTYLCRLFVTDDAGNKSMMVSINEFEIDRSPPVLTLIQKVPEISGSKKPDFKFNSSENGTLSFSCNISSISENVLSGENNVILNELDEKSYDNCSITVLDQAGNRSEELFIDNFTVDTIAPSLKLIEGVPEYTTENSPNIEIEISENGEIVFLDECKEINHIPVFKKETNYIIINDLDDGRYRNCLFKLVDKAGNMSESINLAENGLSFTIDTVKPEIVEELPVEAFSTTLDDLTYMFKSSEDGLINIQGKCRPLSENAIEGLNTIYFINSPGNYTDCMLQVVDFAGNKSDNITLSDFQVIQAEGQSVGFGIGFDPTIEKINCEYNSNDPSRLKISATVKDDGPLSQLRYFWKFCKYCDTYFERTKKFTNEFSNPTFMKDYSIIQTNGTLYLEVTDGNGLGGKTTRELKISPGSC